MRLHRVFSTIAIATTIGLVTLVTPSTGSAPTQQSSAGPDQVRLGAVLVGGNEVPGPGDPDGFGLADVWVKRGEVCWRITVQSVAPVGAAHIHAGPAGVAGPVVVPLAPYNQGCADTSLRIARFIRLHPGDFYVNLHNADFPGGAVRGQLRR
ncbi:CHRD domain-containing protein [Nocardioides immobilis]|uniref:CHRD domain-containing protein n=1 Tax=Nocardioides immobilis TaxID=2049295 RepID=UPI0015F8E6CE|nr:CHRD domain-containing protein [Nocardioides immobilis]